MSTSPPQTPPPSPAFSRSDGDEGVTAAAATTASEATALLSRISSEDTGDIMELRPLTQHDVFPSMENAGFEREDNYARGQSCDRVATVEMNEVAPSPAPAPALAPAAPAPSVNGGAAAAFTCSEHCQALHMQHQRKAAEAAAAGAGGGTQLTESPWHHLKTVFLVGTLVFLALWIVIYTLLSQLSLL